MQTRQLIDIYGRAEITVLTLLMMAHNNYFIPSNLRVTDMKGSQFTRFWIK